MTKGADIKKLKPEMGNIWNVFCIPEIKIRELFPSPVDELEWICHQLQPDPVKPLQFNPAPHPEQTYYVQWGTHKGWDVNYHLKTNL